MILFFFIMFHTYLHIFHSLTNDEQFGPTPRKPLTLAVEGRGGEASTGLAVQGD